MSVKQWGFIICHSALSVAVDAASLENCFQNNLAIKGCNISERFTLQELHITDSRQKLYVDIINDSLEDFNE